MAKRRFPDLSATGRRYLEHTQRARLASPGLERFEVERRSPAKVVAAVAVVVAALAGLLLWLALG
jgi:hypothetical protein